MERDLRPAATYHLFSAGDELLYVGSTYDPKRRFGQHAQTKPWWPQVARREVAWKQSKQAAEDAEKVAIMVEAPRHNYSGRHSWVGALDASMTRRLGLRPLPSDVFGSLAISEMPAPLWVASRIGIEEGTPFAHARRIVTRRGEPLWILQEWWAPRYGNIQESRSKPWERGKELLHIERRQASPAEAGLLIGDNTRLVRVNWFAYTDYWSGDRHGLIEASTLCPDEGGWDLAGASVTARPAEA